MILRTLSCIATIAWLIASPAAASAVDCAQVIHLQTRSLGEIDLPLTATAKQAKSQKLSYLQEVEIPSERCMFQGGIRTCTLRPDTGHIGFTLEMRGDECLLNDSYVTGSETKSIGGKPLEVPAFTENQQKFSCSAAIRCR